MSKSTILLPALLTCAILAASQSVQSPASQNQLPPSRLLPSSTQPADSQEKTPVSVQQDVPYANVAGHPLLLDLYDSNEPSRGLRPAVVLIHGGGWIAFDKSTMRNMGMFLARNGFVGFAVDYRLFHGNENLWPAQLDDVQRAVRWIRANAAKYRIDPDHIGVFGHSAGAQLAALLGMEETRDNSDATLSKYSSRVQAVVDVSGPSDFTTNHDADGDAFLTAFLGGSEVQHAEIWKDASPVAHAAKGCAPFLIVHGTHDESVPLAQAQELADKLNQTGVPVKLVTVDDEHTFRTLEARRRLAFETQEFFTHYLLPSSAK